MSIYLLLSWGVPSSKVYLYVHGQGGNKEEAADFAEIVCRYGFQTLSIDLPGHGERKDEKAAFLPWEVVPEIQSVMDVRKKAVAICFLICEQHWGMV